MRRLLAILLMLLVPIQFAWSAAQSMHGHLGDDVSTVGFHVHDHDHHDAGMVDHDDSPAGEAHDADDGHPDGHYHPVFSMLVIELRLQLGKALPDGPPLRPPLSFTSHIPPLFDWPPSVRA